MMMENRGFRVEEIGQPQMLNG
jgi:hypothetical protein